VKVTFDVLQKELAAQADYNLAPSMFNYGRRRWKGYVQLVEQTVPVRRTPNVR
jgi:hypothetical protein